MRTDRKKLEKQAQAVKESQSPENNDINSESPFSQADELKKECLDHAKDTEYSDINQQLKGLEMLQ